MEEFIKRVLNFEKIKFNKILKSKSGFTNLVFFIDDRYVIKVTDNKKNVEKLHKEIEIYKNVNMDDTGYRKSADRRTYAGSCKTSY